MLLHNNDIALFVLLHWMCLLSMLIGKQKQKKNHQCTIMSHSQTVIISFVHVLSCGWIFLMLQNNIKAMNNGKSVGKRQFIKFNGKKNKDSYYLTHSDTKSSSKWKQMRKHAANYLLEFASLESTQLSSKFKWTEHCKHFESRDLRERIS